MSGCFWTSEQMWSGLSLCVQIISVTQKDWMMLAIRNSLVLAEEKKKNPTSIHWTIKQNIINYLSDFIVC